MSVIVPKSIAKVTEEGKQTSVRSALQRMIDEAQASDHYSTKLPVFLILAFMKFTPVDRRLHVCDKTGEIFGLKNHTVYYQARATMPHPMWGTNLYIIKSGEDKHECVWALPQLAKRSPKFTLERAIKAKRSQKEIRSIIGFMSGELRQISEEYNALPIIQRSVEKLFKNGEIPLVTAVSGEAYQPATSSPFLI